LTDLFVLDELSREPGFTVNWTCTRCTFWCNLSYSCHFHIFLKKKLFVLWNSCKFMKF